MMPATPVSSIRVLVLDDEKHLARFSIRTALELISGHELDKDVWEVQLSGGEFGKIAFEYIEFAIDAEKRLLEEDLSGCDLILLDNYWPRVDEKFGLSLLARMQSAGRSHNFIVLFTAYPLSEDIKEALSCGATALVSKAEPYHLLNILLVSSLARKAKRATELETRLAKGLEGIDNRLVSSSSVMRRALADAAAFAVHDKIPILILGETGTGKELVARAIHKAAGRSNGPLEVLHCAGLQKGLEAAEIFGHEKGAYTGAHKARAGSLRRANNGTLFLDELQDIPLSVQTMLIRALEDKYARPLGGDIKFEFNIRLITATNRDPKVLIASNQLRPDFLERVKGGIVRLPPLRERTSDIEQLVHHFISESGPDAEGREFSPEAVERLCQHDWPGNIRELRMTVIRTLAVSSSRSIRPEEINLDPLVLREGTVADTHDLPTNAWQKLLRVGPSKGVAKRIVEVLVESYPRTVPLDDLQELTGRPTPDSGIADRALQSTISRIRKALSAADFEIEGPVSTGDTIGYRLVFVPHLRREGL